MDTTLYRYTIIYESGNTLTVDDFELHSLEYFQRVFRNVAAVFVSSSERIMPKGGD